MDTKELIALLVAMLKDEIVGEVKEADGTIFIVFENGVVRTVKVL